jgi:hypothetical protein
MQRLWEAGVEQVCVGATSVAELLRVLDVPLPPATEALAIAAHGERRGGILGPERSRATEHKWVREPSRVLDIDVVLASLDDLELTDPD